MNKKYDQIVAHTSYVGHTGYANHARSFFTTMNKVIPTRVRNFAHVSDLSHLTEEHKNILIEQKWAEPPWQVGAPYVRNPLDEVVNIVLMETNHYYFYDQYEGAKIAFNVWESTRQPDQFFAKLLEYDQLWVPTEWQAKVSIEQGYPADRVKVIPEGVDGIKFHPLELGTDVKTILPEYEDGRFKFVIFGRWDYRKATGEMIEAFLRTFDKDEPVDLIISVDNPFPADGLSSTEERLAHHGFIDNRIKVKHFPSDDEYVKYLQCGHVFLSCSRAEGWNLPLIEAIASGIPTISSNYGAQLEFAEGVSHLVNIKGHRKPEQVFMQDNTPGTWAEPDFDHLCEVMRDVYSNYEKYKLDANKKATMVAKKFTWENAVQKALDTLDEFYKDRPKYRKINLGSGIAKKEGFINVDKYDETADLQMDIKKLEFEDNSITEVYTSHTLEHEGKRSTIPILEEIHRVLIPGGLATIEVPDLEYCIREWLNSDDKWGFNLDRIFGHQEDDGEYHKTGFNEDRLKSLLDEVGFKNINIERIWSHEQECLKATMNKGIVDNDVFIIDAYPDTDEKLNILANQILKLKEFAPVCLVTHYPVPIDIQDNVDYFIYDKNNALSENWKLNWWYQGDEVKVVSKVENQYHSASIMVSLHNALSMLCKKHKHAHFVESDIDFDVDAYIKIVRNELLKKKFVSFYYQEEQSIPGLVGILTNIFSFDTEWMYTKLKFINNWDDYTKIAIESASKLGIESDYILENWFYYYLKSNDLLRYCTILDNESKHNIIRTRSLFDQIDSEPKLKILLSETVDNELILFIVNIDKIERSVSIILNYTEFLDEENKNLLHKSSIIEPKDILYFRIKKQGSITVTSRDIAREFTIDKNEVYTNTTFRFIDDRLRCIQEIDGASTTSVNNADVVINSHFVDTPFLEIKKGEGTYKVSFINQDTGELVYSTELSKGHWARPSIKYFINWLIVLEQDNKVIWTHKYNAEGKRVLITIDTKALGDTIAFFPYVEEFRKKHKCIVYVSTFWNKLFKEVYPELIFVEPGSAIPGLYDQYNIGCADNDYNRNKINWREVPLQKVASDYLGLDYIEIKPKIVIPSKVSELSGNYVCISEHSTFQCKYWNYPGGWQSVVNYLNSKKYSTVVISREDTGLQNIIKRTNRSIEDTIATLLGAKLYMGVSSGPAWLAWALGIPVIMISGYSAKQAEMSNGVERIINQDVCNGCFNDPSVPFDRGDWNWCPRNKNFECSKQILPDTVIKSVDKLLKI